jgi:hypothetical protein
MPLQFLSKNLNNAPQDVFHAALHLSLAHRSASLFIIALIPATKSHQGWWYQRVYWQKSDVGFELRHTLAQPDQLLLSFEPVGMALFQE